MGSVGARQPEVQEVQEVVLITFGFVKGADKSVTKGQCSFLINHEKQHRYGISVSHDRDGGPLHFCLDATGLELHKWAVEVLGQEVIDEVLRTIRIKKQLLPSESIPAQFLYFVKKKDTKFNYLSNTETTAFCGKSLRAIVRSGAKSSGKVYLGELHL